MTNALPTSVFAEVFEDPEIFSKHSARFDPFHLGELPAAEMRETIIDELVDRTSHPVYSDDFMYLDGENGSWRRYFSEDAQNALIDDNRDRMFETYELGLENAPISYDEIEIYRSRIVDKIIDGPVYDLISAVREYVESTYGFDPANDPFTWIHASTTPGETHDQ